jgi:hypothetical protein
MSTPSESSSSRYRYVRGRQLDPQEAISPIPNTPQELLAMQQPASADRPEKPEPQASPRVQEVIALIDRLDTSAAEDQQIALRLLHRLESFHDEVVDEMRDDSDASHNQIVAWAVDADRLMRSRILLDSVNLE